MRLTTIFCALTLAASAAGCSGGGAPTAPQITQVSDGSWLGFPPYNNSTLALRLTLTETAGTVTGVGSLIGDTFSLPLVITGYDAAGQVSLSLASAGYQTITLTGTILNNHMTGVLNGSGFTNLYFLLTR